MEAQRPASSSFSIQNTLEKNYEMGRRDIILERLALVNSRLVCYGSYLRDDSRLAYEWAQRSVNGVLHDYDNDWDLESIVHELICTDIIFKTTNYNEMCQLCFPLVYAQMKKLFPTLPPQVLWKHIRTYCTFYLKIEALSLRQTKKWADYIEDDNDLSSMCTS